MPKPGIFRQFSQQTHWFSALQINLVQTVCSSLNLHNKSLPSLVNHFKPLIIHDHLVPSFSEVTQTDQIVTQVGGSGDAAVGSSELPQLSDAGGSTSVDVGSETRKSQPCMQWLT
jgi:hypothetical protein